MLTEARHERTGQPRADQPADARHREGETVLPGGEAQFAQHEHGEQRSGRHDQPVDQDGVEEQRAQHRRVEHVPPAVQQVTGPQPVRPRAPRARFPAADRTDAQRRQEVAHGVDRDRHHRAEQPDRGPAHRRPEHGRGPGRRLEPAVRGEQAGRGHQRLETGTGGGPERDVGRGDHDRHDQQLGEAEPPEGVRERHAQQHRAPEKVRRDHHRPLAPELHPRPQRHRHHRAHRQTRRRERRHPPRTGVQHHDRDQRKGVEREPCAERADRVRGPQPPEPPSQRPAAHHVRLDRIRLAHARHPSEPGAAGSNNRTGGRYNRSLGTSPVGGPTGSAARAAPPSPRPAPPPP